MTLSYLHKDLWLVYGDLELENMLITNMGHIKLTKFGVCCPYTKSAKETIVFRSKGLLQKVKNQKLNNNQNQKKAQQL